MNTENKHFIRRLLPSRKARFWLLGGLVLIAVVAGILVFALKKPVAFTYSGQVCVPQLTLAPSIMKQRSSSAYETSFADTWSLAGQDILALKTCFSPLATPEKGSAIVALSPWGWPLFAKQYEVTVPDPPQPNPGDLVGKTLPTTRPVTISLNAADDTFQYALAMNEQKTRCEHQDRRLTCDITSLGLDQGATYKATLSRSFKGDQPSVVVAGDMKTLRPLILLQSSVEKQKVIYDKPSEFSFSFDKALAEQSAIFERIEGDKRTPVAFSPEMRDRTLIIKPAADLPRNSSYELTIQELVARDGSALAEPLVVPFTTSGGPKVTAVSVGASRAPLSGVLHLTFDQNISRVSEALKLVTVQGITATPGISGDRLSLSYGAGSCQPFTIILKKGIQNEHGIAQDQEYRYSSRTQCHTSTVIGYSAQGRPIIAYNFGSGAKKILFTGAIHGNERNTTALLNAWIDELEGSPNSIPVGTQIVVIPLVNPDGYAANSRYASSTVDLNRNFDTTDWKSDIQTVHGEPFPKGGGSAPASEKETQVLAAYTRQLMPSLTLSYHSVAGYVIANTCGNSASLAASYASLSGYRNMTGVSGAFSYEITGTYDDWMCQRLGLKSVLIELSTSYSAELSRNRSAMWAMLRS